MRTIKPLPEAARNSMRSAIVLFDLTRVLEELLFNSLDAGATKVSVFVGVATCYLKVVDNGFGISRDGLVLLGERYATSKLFHMAEMDAKSQSFGFRGEALASISDVSLLEVVTKSYGVPNGYRKVMKGCNCLYLGIDDDRKDVGTTVIVRDLFHNQPVRRKYMQSSHKKVLHSVKKCVLRIALVHSKVSFNVVDIESEDVLLCMQPSSSPLSLLMKSFGIADSICLREVNASHGPLELSGYISGPSDSLAFKAFQYIYINSRFVSRGPIHKMLNHLSASYEHLNLLKGNSEIHKGKRSRPQADPTYFLNLSCPQSHYDLTLEPSKTYAEFKTWEPILTFIKKAIQPIWREGKGTFVSAPDMSRKADMLVEDDKTISLDEDFLEISKVSKRKHRIRSPQTSSHPHDGLVDEVNKDGDYLFLGESESCSFQEFYKNTTQFKEQKIEPEFLHQTSNSLQSWSTVIQGDEKCLWTTRDSDFLGNGLTTAEITDSLWSRFADKPFKVEHSLKNDSKRGARYVDLCEFSIESDDRKGIGKSFLTRCTSQPTFDGSKLASEVVCGSPIDVLNTKQSQVFSNETSNIKQVGLRNISLDCSPRDLWQDETPASQQHDRLIGSSSFPRDFAKAFPSLGEPSAVNKFDLEAVLLKSSSGYQPRSAQWCSGTFNPLFRTGYWDVEHTRNDTVDKNTIWHKKSVNGDLLNDEGNAYKFTHDILSKSSHQGNCSPIIQDNNIDISDYNPGEDFGEVLQEQCLRDRCSMQHKDVLIDEMDWLCHSNDHNYNDIDECKNRSDKFSYHLCKQNPFPKRRSIRSHSAPPFHKQKRKFVSLSNHLAIEVGKFNAERCGDAITSQVADDSKHPQHSSGVCHTHLQLNSVEDVACNARSEITKKVDTSSEIINIDEYKKSLHPETQKDCHVEDVRLDAIQDSLNYGTKWRHRNPKVTSAYELCNIHNEDSILDISSGILQHLADDSLVPGSISKSCLKDAKVLHQVDKKFIPVVAGGTLVLIDQHAADERIRLEELRQKVLSGDEKRITYLDGEQELILPEIGHQLLQNYAEQIKDWGWICNIHVQDSKLFKKNLSVLHRKPTDVTLLAVPCILGVNLSDIDLLEFLQQLADTDGSSTMPPSVLRVLNSKACRGAIMFGDSLLPSECSLIVEELKQTSLCFQCAHGRPTTAPLVNMDTLHKQIAKLVSTESWHGMYRKELSINRAMLRLRAARGLC